MASPKLIEGGDKMRRSVKPRVTSVTALLPVRVDIAKLKAGNSLEFKVKSDNQLLGTLLIGRGSVEWWPKGNKTNRLRKTWSAFASLLDQQIQ
jgi:hypothetical protein